MYVINIIVHYNEYWKWYLW